MAIGSRSHGSTETEKWLAQYQIDRFGSSLKFCLVASGKADIHLRFGRTMEWDTAAGDAVLRGAGGVVTTADKKPLVYNKRGQANEMLISLTAHFIAYGDATFFNGA